MSKKNKVIEDLDKEHFLYCDTRGCPHRSCIRRVSFAPFDEVVYVRRFKPDKDWNCEGFREE